MQALYTQTLGTVEPCGTVRRANYTVLALRFRRVYAENAKIVR